MISRELLSKVLDEDNSVIGEYTYISKHKNMVHIGIELDGIPKEKKINIYELADKCKAWCVEQKYPLETLCAENFVKVKVYQGHWIEKPKIVFQEHTEIEAIFKACEWILNEIPKT